MQPLDSLIRTAAADAASLDPGSASRSIQPAASPGEAEVARIMQICNACRYCEGFCAVFPAMTRRLEFLPADSHYLANLCHNCGACYHACQYAPPHAFAVNVPRALAVVRLQTYTDHAWPAAFGTLYKKNGLTVALAVAAGLVLFLLLAAAGTAPLLQSQLGVGFYGVFSHRFMANLFGVVFGFAVLALGIGVTRFWRSVSPGAPTTGTALAAGAEAAGHALALTYLGGGHGAGCNEADDRFTLARRRFHHLTFYGFMLCLAATSVATLYHYVLSQPAPYALTSLPVLLGTAGGIGLVIGPAGLLWLNWRRDPIAGDPAQKPMDRGFIALLLLISISGLALLAWRETRAMPLLLITHLGVVMALFLTMPYSKFAHGFYRCAALLKSSIEKRQPSRLRLGAD